MAPVSLGTIYLILLLAIGSNSDSTNTFPKEGNVLILSDKNFGKALQSNKYLLVMFYAPWCGYSKALQTVFSAAADQLAKQKSSVKLAKINSPLNQATQSKYKIHGYPTLKFFKNGKVSDYKGKRDAKSIVSFAKSQSS